MVNQILIDKHPSSMAGAPLGDGIRMLLENATAGTAEELCSRLAARLLPDSGPTDDVAVLAIRMTDGRTGRVGALP